MNEISEYELVEKINNYMSKKLKTEYYYSEIHNDYKLFVINNKDSSILIHICFEEKFIKIKINEDVFTNPTSIILKPIKNHELLYKKGLNIGLNILIDIIIKYIFSKNYISIRGDFSIAVNELAICMGKNQLPTYYRNNNPLKSNCTI